MGIRRSDTANFVSMDGQVLVYLLDRNREHIQKYRAQLYIYGADVSLFLQPIKSLAV